MFPLYDNNPSVRTPWVTIAIILVNLVVQIFVAQMPPERQFEVYCEYGFIPARVHQLTNPQLVLESIRPMDELEGVVQPIPDQVITLQPHAGEIYLSVLTMMFLHGGWLHLLGNMWFLWIFGNNIEDRLGHVLYILYYLVGGAIAMAVQYWMDSASTIPTIGASGAISAVLGAYAVTFPWAKVRTLIMLVIIITVVDIPALVLLGFFFLLDVASTLNPQLGAMQEGVAFWAHIGGFTAGMLLMPLLSLATAPTVQNWNAEAENQFKFDDPNR